MSNNAPSLIPIPDVPTAKRITLIFGVTALLSYVDLMWGKDLALPVLPHIYVERLTSVIPGLFFGLGLAIYLGVMRRIGPLIFAVAFSTTGWYAAYTIAERIVVGDSLYGKGELYVAGAVSGLVGGLGVGLAVLLVSKEVFTKGRVIILAACGSVLGAMALPIGFLFHDGGTFLLLTFLIWQLGIGYALFALGQRPVLSA